MYQRYYDGYDEVQSTEPVVCAENAVIPKDEIQLTGFSKQKNIFGNLAIDDLLLIGVFLLLLNEDCDDKLMLIIIGFLFVSGI